MFAKRIVIVTVVAMLCMAAFAPAVAASQRRGELRAAKECSGFVGAAGGFCTFKRSNIDAIGRGDRIYYLQDATATELDADVVIVAGPGNVANGHCKLVLASLPGHCRFSGGTGAFEDFHARVAVSVDSRGIWHWEGTYSFR
jgi:hypothetical protein